MAVYSVDSDAVLAATAAVRATGERIRADTHTMLAQLADLQGQWTGAASGAFAGVVEQWRAAHTGLDEALASIGVALESAGRQYADAEHVTLGLFR